MISAYRELLRRPGVARLVIAALIGRMPLGIVGIAIVLLVHRATGSFAAAGLVDAFFGAAAAVGAPSVGRLIDRYGQTRMLVASAAIHSLSLSALVAAALGRTGTGAMAAAAAVAGASLPPLSGSMRVLWPGLAGEPARVATAFALESIAVEGFFIAGPVLCGLLVALASPAAAVITAAGLTLIGTGVFASAPASRRWRPDPCATRSRGGALASAGIRAVVLSVGAEGAAFGVLGVAVPAFAVRHGLPAAAGWLLALQAAGSAAGGLWYGARHWKRPLPRRFAELFALFTLGLVPLAVAGSVPVLGALLVLAGLALAPLTAVSYQLVSRLAPAGTATEANTWLSTAVAAGSAIGAGTGGAVVQSAGVPAALLTAAAVAAAGPLVAVAGRRALERSV